MNTKVSATILALSFLMGTGSNAQQVGVFWLDESVRAQVQDTSMRILNDIDASVASGNFGNVYSNASSVIRSRITQNDYSHRLTKLRANLDRPTERVLQSVEGGFTSLPNRPDGEYVLVTYDLRFSSVETIFTEQLILKKEPNMSADAWALASYRIAPKPNSPIL